MPQFESETTFIIEACHVLLTAGELETVGEESKSMKSWYKNVIWNKTYDDVQ